MNDLRKAAEMALDALEADREHITYESAVYSAALALRQALAQPEEISDYHEGWEEGFKAGLAKAQPEQEPVAGWDSIEAMASKRYKVVPSHDSMFYRHAVVAGNGTQQLYIGREVECENMARKFAGAFLDGAFVMQSHTSPPNVPMARANKPWVGLTGDEVNDLKHWLDHRAQWSYIEFARAIEAKLKELNHV